MPVPHRLDGRPARYCMCEPVELRDMALRKPLLADGAAPAAEHRRIDVDDGEAARQEPRPVAHPLHDQEPLADALARLLPERVSIAIGDEALRIVGNLDHRIDL